MIIANLCAVGPTRQLSVSLLGHCLEGVEARRHRRDCLPIGKASVCGGFEPGGA